MNDKPVQDKLYAQPVEQIVDFVFDERVAGVFPDMIRRSVPGYENIIALLGLIAEQYARDNSRIYDLGCSLGAATFSMRKRARRKNLRFIAVDNAAAMIEAVVKFPDQCITFFQRNKLKCKIHDDNRGIADIRIKNIAADQLQL